MALEIAYGDCFGCGRPFWFSPTRVPSTRDADGVRQPICADCVARANPRRVANGLPPIEPLAGAYDFDGESDQDWAVDG